jgi:hypothetical protein
VFTARRHPCRSANEAAVSAPEKAGCLTSAAFFAADVGTTNHKILTYAENPSRAFFLARSSRRQLAPPQVAGGPILAAFLFLRPGWDTTDHKILTPRKKFNPALFSGAE